MSDGARKIRLRELLETDQEFFERSQIRVVDPNPVYEGYSDYQTFLGRLRKQARNEDPATMGVPMLQLFGFVGDEIVGRFSLRTSLNDYFNEYAGNVGYFVLTEYRGRGFATEMLRQGLVLAAAAGLKRVLVTCREGNQASVRTIEKCNGVFERTAFEPKGHILLRRYWIETG